MTIWGVAPGAQGSDPTAGLRLELVAVELVHLFWTQKRLWGKVFTNCENVQNQDHIAT